MQIEIKPATVDDYPQIFTLIKEFATFIQTPEKVLTSPKQMVEDKDFFHCFVAFHGNKIVGFATYFYAYYSWTGKAVYLDDLYVLEKYRGNGIGTRLHDTIVETAKNTACRKVKWQVSNWNQKAIEFYKNRGAVIDMVEINCDLVL